MRRLLVRRSATAAGIYLSVGLGVLSTIVATRELHSATRFGDYATVLFAVGLLQGFFDLTVEEAMVKYGFRYIAHEDWGRLRRLIRCALAFKITGGVAAALGLVVFAVVGPHRLEIALLLGALVPIAQSLEGLSGVMLYLRGRYDIRSGFLAWSMGLRLTGVAVGAHWGVAQAVAGVLGAQVVATLSVATVGLLAYRRFPHARSRLLAEDRREIRSFVIQSSAASGVLSLRTSLGPLLLGAVSSTSDVGLFKVAQAPQSGFQAMSAPVRMVLLTEQTRDWEHGRQTVVIRGVKRYTLGAAVLAAAIVPPAYIFIPWLIRHINGPQYVGASGAARLFLLAAAAQLVVGWTKSFPVTIGRPELRLHTHAIEAAVVLPLILLFGRFWGATGAGGAVFVGTVVFAILWFAILHRVQPVDDAPPPPLDEALAVEEDEAGALVR